MSRDKAEYHSDWKTRVLPAKHGWPCDKCGGWITKDAPYINRDLGRKGGRWAGHEHIDCQAAWWQVDIEHLLRAVGSTPHAPPPDSATQAVLEEIPVTISLNSDTTGRIDWHLPEAYRRQLLHTPDIALRKEAMEAIKLSLGLLADCIIKVSGQKEASLQLSNIMQQMRQTAATATVNTERMRKKRTATHKTK